MDAITGFKKLNFQNKLLALLIVGLVVAFLFNFAKRLSTNLSTALTPPADGSTPTFSAEQAVELADKLEKAMGSFGSSFTDMTKWLKVLNGADLKKVYQAFGNRKYLMFGSAALLGTEKNLFEWFEEELDGREYAQMTAIWEKSGLKMPII